MTIERGPMPTLPGTFSTSLPKIKYDLLMRRKKERELFRQRIDEFCSCAERKRYSCEIFIEIGCETNARARTTVQQKSKQWLTTTLTGLASTLDIDILNL